MVGKLEGKKKIIPQIEVGRTRSGTLKREGGDKHFLTKTIRGNLSTEGKEEKGENKLKFQANGARKPRHSMTEGGERARHSRRTMGPEKE